jgi:hypothetical protein
MNAYGENISKKVNMLNQQHIIHEKQNNEMDHNTDITSQLESTTLKHENVHGGNPVANTSSNSGSKPTLQTKGEPVPKKRTRKKQESAIV